MKISRLTIFSKSQFLVAIVVFVILACNNYNARNQTNNIDNTKLENENTNLLEFDLSNPTKKIGLPLELQEISALSYLSENKLVCLHDEKADVFVINYQSGKIASKSSSGVWGDYEGIEYVKNTLWLTRADGELMEIKNFMKENEKKRTYKIDKVSSKNDVEGLGYDVATNSLLMAFKNKAGLKDEKVDKTRRVYRFDLQTKEIIEKPFLEIDLEKLEKKHKVKNFMPSGIASHPNNGNFYIISAVGNWLLVLNRESEVINVTKLDPAVFRQPEGICFNPDGQTLFISNEGKNKKGNILIFNAL